MAGLAALPRIIAGYWAPAASATRSAAGRRRLPDSAGMATPHAAPAVSSDQTYSYFGLVTMSGTFSDGLGQHAKFSGTLNDMMTVTMDSSGNGTGSESFFGLLTATVTNPDGSIKTSQSEFDFDTPDFTLKGGRFSVSQVQDVGFEGATTTLNLNGAFGKTQASFTEYLRLPFSGTYEGTTINGSINGVSTLNTPPLTVTGASLGQFAFAGEKMTPFKFLSISDLDYIPVTVTIKLSNPKNGTLSNLAGGKYDKATGVYTITAYAGAADRALNGLLFDPTGNLGTYDQAVATGFAISVTDADGASLSNSAGVSATQPLGISGTVIHQTTTVTKAAVPFRVVSISDLIGGDVDFVTVKLSNAGNGTLTNLGGGFYNKKTGVYAIRATAATATTALRGLKFDPSAAAGAASTSFTISVSNTAGASATNTSTSVVVSASQPAAIDGGGVALFSQYVAAGLRRMADHAAEIATHRDLTMPAHLVLATSHG